MRVIVPLVIQNYRLFLKICNHRQHATKNALLGIGPSVKKAYTKFMRTKPRWSQINRDMSLASHRASLEGNYDHDQMEVIKDRLKQNGRDGGNCPYCGFGEISEIDHFLPSSRYPEFSIFTYNLVPACHRCNNLKRTVGGVSFHPYYDLVIVNEFLKSRVLRVPRSNLYKATFSIDISLLTAAEADFVSQLYRQLDLLKRYGDISTNYIERLRVDYAKLNNYFLMNFLQSRYDSCTTTLGVNHYETAILKSLLQQNAINPIWP